MKRLKRILADGFAIGLVVGLTCHPVLDDLVKAVKANQIFSAIGYFLLWCFICVAASVIHSICKDWKKETP